MFTQNFFLHFIAIVALANLSLREVRAETTDWRLELLKNNGQSDDTEALQKIQKSFEFSKDKLMAAYEMLGAEAYPDRQQAEWEIHQMGRNAYTLLSKLPRSADLEVRIRLSRIGRVQNGGEKWTQRALLQHAVASLLNDRKEEGKRDRLNEIYAEFFESEQKSLDGGYKKFDFRADKRMGGLVKKGMLRMDGSRKGDGDQRLLLDLEKVTDRKTFPDSYSIEVKLGGEKGGEGGYHVGVSIGNVRVLFHPGYRGGGFRLERVDDNEYIVGNKNMGFDPAAATLHTMRIDVERRDSGGVGLAVSVEDGGSDESFYHADLIESAVIGDVKVIGLDRSGRTGGDGVFESVVVDFGVGE